ncbi:hypothetical protein B0J17DRAFT_715248 [Rhizoctonia solani]|nr:hypothetical protein B0J17DRAFT_715248 [Rhizoctonia solani]
MLRNPTRSLHPDLPNLLTPPPSNGRDMKLFYLSKPTPAYAKACAPHDPPCLLQRIFQKPPPPNNYDGKITFDPPCLSSLLILVPNSVPIALSSLGSLPKNSAMTSSIMAILTPLAPQTWRQFVGGLSFDEPGKSSPFPSPKPPVYQQHPSVLSRPLITNPADGDG